MREENRKLGVEIYDFCMSDFIMNYRVYAKRVAIQRHESILESLKIRHRKFQQRQNQTLLFG